jgi:hypothetical protein
MRPKQTVEMEVKVDGRTHYMNYRVEAFDWTLGGTDYTGRIDRLRRLIADYDPTWELVQIGMSEGDYVTVMFRQRY